MQNTFSLELANYLQNNETVGNLILGENFWVDHMPPDNVDCVMLFTDSGMSQDMYLDTRYQNITFWVRNSRGDAAVATTEQILLVLHRLNNVLLGRYYLYFIYASTGIMNIDSDSRRRKIYKITFNAIYRDTSVIS